MNAPPPLTVQEAVTHHRTAVVVWAALFLGPAVFAVVVRGLVENETAIATVAPMGAGTGLLIWAVMAATALAGALIFRARAAAVGHRRDAYPAVATDAPSPATVLTNLVVSWALAEGQLLLAMALYFMSGDVALWWGALGLHLVALAGGYPRRPWFTGLVAP